MEHAIKVGSLFSGIGGLDIGFDNQGFKTIWFCDDELFCQSVLRKHWPKADIYGDIKKINFKTVPKVDVLTGGFPCQDISNAGKRVGITGSRSSLWKCYKRAIGEIRPKFALIENVAALTKRGLNVVLADLAEIRYDAEWYNISASAVGAPHRRERIFIIAYPSSVRSDEIHDEIQSDESNGEVFDGACSERNDTDSDSARQLKHILSETGRFEVKNNWSKEQRQTQSPICRMDDGVSCWPHRIKSLGNAVVPQCAEIFAQAIKEQIEKEM